MSQNNPKYKRLEALLSDAQKVEPEPPRVPEDQGSQATKVQIPQPDAKPAAREEVLKIQPGEADEKPEAQQPEPIWAQAVTLDAEPEELESAQPVPDAKPVGKASFKLFQPRTPEAGSRVKETSTQHPAGLMDCGNLYPPWSGGGATATHVIGVTSGKGGVGKTNVVANLGYALTRLNKRVLLVDADIGLANLDVILGFSPRYNLQHVLSGEKAISEVIIAGPGGMKILPASSGIQELSELTRAQKLCLLAELETLSRETDIILIDTSAGISSNVMYFNLAAHEILIVVSPEPTSITDAYAMMKVLCLKYEENHFKLLVNGARSAEEAQEVYHHLSLVGEKFLNLSIDYWGYIIRDEHVVKAVRQQKAFIELHPQSAASKCIYELAQKVSEYQPNTSSRGSFASRGYL